jgi:glycosyltransferase involved in cell wall biosynthesis
MRVIYLTDSIGAKQNGGSGLSGLRFLELLVGRYGRVHVVTEAVRNVPAGGPGFEVTAIRRDPPPFAAGARALARAVAIRLINLRRRRTATVDARGNDVLVVCNSFYTILDRVRIVNARSVRRACVVRGDVNSFEYQGFGEDAATNPLRAPLAFLHEFDALVFVSQTTKRNWERLLARPQGRFLLPNAIDETEVDGLLARSREEVRRELGWAPGEFHVVVVGSLQKRKGQDVFVPAAEALGARMPNARVHFVGVISPPFGGVEMADALRKADLVCYTVHGHRDDALTLVHAGDVAVMVSHSEAFPRSVAEYMALGKAIVTTPVAGADEMVIDGETGLLIPMADPEALVAALARVAGDPALRDRLGTAARARYLTEYAMTSQARRFGEIFDAIDAGVVHDVVATGDARS